MKISKPYAKSIYYSGTKKLKQNLRIELNLLPKVKKKEVLSIKEQILYMKYKGISFQLIDEVQSTKILGDLNYYFKISVYRKFFTKKYSNKYINLDFKMLTDLASIDMGVRYFLLQLTLDIEHAVKTAIIKELTNNPLVNDGYLIVRQFKNKESGVYKQVRHRFKNTKYMKDFHSKRENQLSYWILIELLDMGGLTKFLDFYLSSTFYGKGNVSIDVRNSNKLLIYIKNIRNCTAHSNPFIFNIFDNRIPSSSQLVSYAANIGIDSHFTRYDKVNDLVALFHLHKYLCSDVLNKRRKSEGEKLLLRSQRMKMYYKGNVKLRDTYTIFQVLLDTLVK